MRFKIIRFLFLIAAVLVVIRLFYWQVLNYEFLTAKAESQRVDNQEITGSRGIIYFSDGTTLASSQPTFLVYALPKVLKEKEKVAEKLAGIFWEEANFYKDLESIDEREAKRESIKKIEMDLVKKMSQDLYWVSLGRRVSLENKERIEKMEISGIGFDIYTSRFYPEGSSSAHILGFVGSNEYGGEAGYFGLEGYYNGELKGKSGFLRREKDALGLPILIGSFLSKEAKAGKSMFLNIDRTVQYIVEEKLKKGLEKYGAKGVSAAVMDPKNGEILAMASLPSYDPARASEFAKDYYKNPLIADGYEPGSTFKVLVMAAGINERVVEPDTKCDTCDGPLKIGGFTVRTWNNKYQKDINMTDVIVHSDNTGMVFVAKKLGMEKLYEYITNFGFGDLTGIDLQDEYSPDLRAEKEWREIDLATASFGQGISVTGMQLIRAVSAIANKGQIMEPHVVSRIKDRENETVIKPRVVGNPISEDTAKKITEMMVRAVDWGEARVFKPKGYKIAGKTGTAQIPIAGHYDPNKTIASFIGFAPADDPKFVMLVRYQEPSSSIYGAETAAPTFFEIAKELFTYYGIAPGE